MCMTPKPAIRANQTTSTGPKNIATLAVPRNCTAKRPLRMTRLVRITTEVVTECCSAGTVFSPSIADSTEIAGVMMESP